MPARFTRTPEQERQISEATITISPRLVLIVLLTVIFALITASTIAGAAWYLFDRDDSTFSVVQMFWIDSEMNVPTLYSAVALTIASVLLAAIALLQGREGSPYARHWKVLAIVFVYLAIDEGARLHERTVLPLRSYFAESRFATNDFLTAGSPWVILGSAFSMIMLIAYVGFLRSLPPRIRNLMLLSGTMFVTGAIGFEILSYVHAVEHGKETLTYALLATVEEVLEMTGIAVFIYSLVTYLGSLPGSVAIRFAPR